VSFADAVGLLLGGSFFAFIFVGTLYMQQVLGYVEVDRVDEQTDRARQLGAHVLLEPREGPAGWRSVVSAPSAGEIAFWEPKP
jgi:predicted enzyme related to lactoylglutathione lyase